MALSESFGLGNSTFMNLENEINKAFNEKSKENSFSSAKENIQVEELDAIDESPTNCKTSLGTSCSRNFTMGAQKQSFIKSRSRQFRKSKSDSTFDSPHSKIAAKVLRNKEENNYSEFFKSELDFEVPTFGLEILKGNQLNSFVSVSEIEAILDGCEEQKHRSENNSSFNDMFTHSSKDCCSDKYVAANKSTKLYAENNEQLEYQCAEEFINVDETSFICAGTSHCKESLEKDLRLSKTCLSATISKETLYDDTSIKKSSTLSKQINLNMSSMEFGQLKWSPNTLSQFTESTSPIKPKVYTDLNNLKHISSWNLPNTILKEYERKGITEMFDWQIECLSNSKVECKAHNF